MADFFWAIADPHLCEKNEKETKLFLDFINYFSGSDCQRLFILGDLFSHWIATEKGLSSFQRNILYELKKTGKEIIFLTGNRDYFVEELKESPFVYSGKTFKLTLPSSKIVFFEHGETINKDDRQYLIWSAVSRTNAVKSFLEIVPKKILENIAQKVEENLSQTNQENKTEIPIKHLKKYAACLREEGIDTIILGHFHKRLSLNYAGVKIEILDKFFPDGSFGIMKSDYEIQDKTYKNLQNSSNRQISEKP